eukprot:m.1212997 g.1212997  ORF g.1212997 m.1212997 type:complete len:188 (-) comp24601_c0_seq8:3058-3621(-)
MFSRASKIFSRTVQLQSGSRWLRTTNKDRGDTFKIMGVQQIAIGALDKGPLVTLWQEIFGCKKIGSYQSEKENVDEDILTVGRDLWEVEIDLMQPLDADKSPKVHVPALNHIGLWVDNIHNAKEELEGKGVRFAPGGIRKGAAGHDVAFLHPKGNEAFPIGGGGVLIELVQAPPELIEKQNGYTEGQ